MISFKYLILLSTLTLAHFCSTAEHHKRHSKQVSKDAAHFLNAIQTDSKLGSLKAPQLWHMNFSAQPSKKDLANAKKAGVEVVISLRNEKENPYNEAAEAKKLGLEYHQIPLFDDKGEIDSKSVAKLEELHHATHKQKQLIHCSSGNRAAAWFAIHVAKKHQLSADDSEKIGEKLGMDKDNMKTQTRTFIKNI
ncbi:hypothetical protein GW915_10770 [bacterium]|nr:hypothetical protein [bacterium]